MRIAYQGARGAFSHEACLEFLPGHEPVAFGTFAEVVAAVGQNEAELGILPLCNVEAGETGARELIEKGRLAIIEEVFLPVRMHLLGLKRSRLQQIRTVVSHPIALRQCARSLAELGVRTEEASNTALAAKELANPGRAVLASEAAAALYGLKILVWDMQDNPTNATCFAIVAGRPR